MGFCVARTRNGSGSGVALVADRGLALLHRLEHGRLGLGAAAVDLVEQHEVGVHRAELGLERAGVLVVDLRADDVAGQQVGRALDAVEAAADGLRDRLGGGRLGQARDALEEHVATRQQGDEQGLLQPRLADDLRGERGRDGLDGLAGPVQLVGRQVARRCRGGAVGRRVDAGDGDVLVRGRRRARRAGPARPGTARVARRPRLGGLARPVIGAGPGADGVP